MPEPAAARAGIAGLRRRSHLQLSPLARTKNGLSLANKCICLIIVLSSVLAILETEPTFVRGWESGIYGLELAFTAIFVLEYAARVWTAVEDPAYRHPLWGRLRYVLTVPAIVDLLAILPVLLLAGASDAILLRLFRLFRILRLARLGRFSMACNHVLEAIRSRRHELLLSLLVAVIALVVSSTLLFLAEGAVQPATFGSIPRAMWWSIATLTTVGYGDVYPVTVLGKVLAAFTAVMGIGLIAMPTGILAAAMSDAFQRRQHRAIDQTDPAEQD
ncbi:MAG: ion transporter [Sneathiellaceae bacterium]